MKLVYVFLTSFCSERLLFLELLPDVEVVVGGGGAGEALAEAGLEPGLEPPPLPPEG